jgi:hypothetical protein
MSSQENQDQLVINQPEAGIFMTEHDMQNMKMERFVVSNPTILDILKKILLTKDEQQEAVDSLVHRTPDWATLDTEDQIARIKSVLTTETVLLYLEAKKYIRPNVDLVEVGVDPEGSVVVYVFYTGTNREKRRAYKKKHGEEHIQQLIDEHNFMGGQNIVDMAQVKLERMMKAKEAKEKNDE